MSTPVTAPQVPSYANRTPYITAAEYLASPTGVDVTQLIPGGTTAQNQAALVAVIARASSWADSLCYQVLAATADVAAGRYRVQPDGTVRIPLPYTPILQVTQVQAGWSPSTLSPLDLTDAWIGPKTVTVPLYGLTAPYGYSYAPMCPGTVYTVADYVNGYANTTLAAQAAAGATNITVASGLGVLPGLQLTISDGASTEVAAVTAVNGATITVAPLAFPHTAGVSVTALPQAVKQAVVCLTSALIKTRGAEAITMAALTQEPSKVDGLGGPGGFEDVEVAVDLLQPFRRVV